MHNGSYFDGSDWLAMSSMMLLWVVLIGVAVYIGVRLATRSSRGGA